MFQFTTLYYRVDNEELLETFFSTRHLPLAEQLPYLVKSEVQRVSGKPGGESRFHLAYSLYFSDERSFLLAVASEPGLQMLEALKQWADEDLLVWFHGDSFEEYVDYEDDSVDENVA